MRLYNVNGGVCIITMGRRQEEGTYNLRVDDEPALIGACGAQVDLSLRWRIMSATNPANLLEKRIR